MRPGSRIFRISRQSPDRETQKLRSGEPAGCGPAAAAIPEGKVTRMANPTKTAKATPPERPTPQPDEGTRLAYERTMLAHERTLMAWLRTAVSLITFGFTIYKFFALELGGKGQQAVHQIIGPRSFALIMIAIGLFALLAATLENARYRSGLRKDYQKAGYSLSGLISAMITALGLLALASVIFRW